MKCPSPKGNSNGNAQKVITITHVNIIQLNQCNITDSKVLGANMGPTWALLAPNGPHVGPMKLAIRDPSGDFSSKRRRYWCVHNPTSYEHRPSQVQRCPDIRLLRWKRLQVDGAMCGLLKPRSLISPSWWCHDMETFSVFLDICRGKWIPTNANKKTRWCLLCCQHEQTVGQTVRYLWPFVWGCRITLKENINVVSACALTKKGINKWNTTDI